MLRRGTGAVAAAVSVAAVLASPQGADASAAPDFELPFACGEQWTGSTRATHGPSRHAVDLNRPRDLGWPVVASAAGVVTRVQDDGARGYGRWVEIAHAGGYRTVYAHLAVTTVASGQAVDQGVMVGRVGATGRVTGAHLHHEQRLGRDVLPAVFHGSRVRYRTPTTSQSCPDVPLAGDWDGDGAADVAVFRRGPRVATFLLTADGTTSAAVSLGRSGDHPLVGDWDGDGAVDVGVRRQASRIFLLRRDDGTVERRRWGLVGDVPLAGDWDGDGTTEIGVYRPAARRFRLLGADGTVQVVPLGGPAVQPVTGDWDGDGRTDLGVRDTATGSYLLRTVTEAGTVTTSVPGPGGLSDLPVAGDWDGDGIADLGSWAPDTATFTLQVTPRGVVARRPGDAEPTTRTVVFGRPR